MIKIGQYIQSKRTNKIYQVEAFLKHQNILARTSEGEPYVFHVDLLNSEFKIIDKAKPIVDKQSNTNQLFTIENFVDVVNEVLLQVYHDDELYDCIQKELNKFLKKETNLDQFGFEFAMIMKDKLSETVRGGCK